MIVIYREIFSVFFVLMFLASCQSTLEINTFPDKTAQGAVGKYSFDLPSAYYLTNADSLTYNILYQSGVQFFDLKKLQKSSSGDSECDFNVDDIYSATPVLTVTNCTGNGQIQLSYGENMAIEFLVSNITTPAYASGFDLKITNSGDTAYLIDNGTDTLYRVNLGTGVKEVIHSPSVGGGDSLTSGTGLYLNSAETKAYVVDNGADALKVIDLATGFATIVSDGSVGSGTNLQNATRVVVDSTETYAYVLDRGAHSILKITISDGARVALSQYVDVSYGLDLAVDDNTLYYIERDTNILYKIDIALDSAFIISQNNVGDPYNYSTPHGLVLDPSDENFAYVINTGGDDALFRVNLITGEKNIIAKSGDRGIGTPLGTSLGVSISPDGQTAYVSDVSSDRDAIVRIEISSGNRTFLSK